MKLACIALSSFLLIGSTSSPAWAQAVFPASTKSGGTVSTGPDAAKMPSGPPAPPTPHPNVITTPDKKIKTDIPIKGLVETYTDSRDESLKKLPALIAKPPKDPATARSQLATMFEPPQRNLSSVQRVKAKRAGKGGGGGSVPLDVERERVYLDKLYKLASQALEHQLELAANRRSLMKAIEDAPQLIKALAEELQAVEDKVKGYLKKTGPRIAERERKRKEHIKQVVEIKAQLLEITEELKRKEKEKERILAEVKVLVQDLGAGITIDSERARKQQRVEENKKQLTEIKSEVREMTEKRKRQLKEVEELMAEIKEAGAIISGDREKDRARKFAQTVGENVQHAWLKILEAGKDLLEKKGSKPETYKRRMDKIISTTVHQISHTENAPAPYKTSAQAIEKALKKSYTEYKKTHEDCIAARLPLKTGSAVHTLPSFKGVKPDEIKARALKVFKLKRD